MSSDPWTFFLDLAARVVMPDWGGLVQLLPLPLLALAVLWVLHLVARWSALAPGGGSGVAGRRIGLWPWLIPVGVLITVAGLLVPSSPDEQTGDPSLVNLPILLVGLAFSLFAVAATIRQWERTEAG